MLLSKILCVAAAAVAIHAEDIQMPIGEKKGPLSVCDLDSEHMLAINVLDLSPNPPMKGEDLHISLEAELAGDIDPGSYLEVEVRYGFITLLKTSLDLCEQTSSVDKEELSCPINAGYKNLVRSISIPNEVPPGKYSVKARAYTPDKKLITCLEGGIAF